MVTLIEVRKHLGLGLGLGLTFIAIPDNLVKLGNLFFNNYMAADFFFRLPAEPKPFACLLFDQTFPCISASVKNFSVK